MRTLPASLEYPIIAIGDLHGRAAWLEKLLDRLRALPEWPRARVVFLGDYVDRHDKVRELVDIILQLLDEKPASTAVIGNHDLALLHATGLDGEPDPYWVKRYAEAYDHAPTFESYLQRSPDDFDTDDWREDLEELKAAIPQAHREFFCSLRWGVEAAGHVFLHNGLSPELEEPAHIQWELIKRCHWHGYVHPRVGSVTAIEYKPSYPVWLGADKKLSDHPLPLPGRIQVTGHVKIASPDANRVRIRIDTSGGVTEPLTACLLRDARAEPIFLASNQ